MCHFLKSVTGHPERETSLRSSGHWQKMACHMFRRITSASRLPSAFSPIYSLQSRTIGTVMTTSKPAGITRRGRSQRNLSWCAYPVRKNIEYPHLPLKNHHPFRRASSSRKRRHNEWFCNLNGLYIHRRTNHAKNYAFSPENGRFGAVYCSFGGLFGAQNEVAHTSRTERATALCPWELSSDLFHRT